jgi:predicted DNA-binding transcriptional regulator YafY
VTRTEVSPTETLPPVALTPEEAAAVVAALAAHPDGPYAGHRLGALRKVLDALEPDPSRRAALFVSSIESGQLAAVRAVLEQAVLGRRVVVLRYQDGKGRPSRREVEPQLLARSSEQWFLVAWCRERQAPRWFRLDRIASARPTEETAPRRDPALFGAPSSTHPAGKGLGRPAGPDERRRGLRVLPGGRQ